MVGAHWVRDKIGKFLGTPGIWRNGPSSSHIHDRLYHKFNKRTPPGMWGKRAPFSILWKYLKITRQNVVFWKNISYSLWNLKSARERIYRTSIVLRDTIIFPNFPVFPSLKEKTVKSLMSCKSLQFFTVLLCKISCNFIFNLCLLS